MIPRSPRTTRVFHHIKKRTSWHQVAPLIGILGGNHPCSYKYIWRNLLEKTGHTSIMRQRLRWLLHEFSVGLESVRGQYDDLFPDWGRWGPLVIFMIHNYIVGWGNASQHTFIVLAFSILEEDSQFDSFFSRTFPVYLRILGKILWIFFGSEISLEDFHPGSGRKHRGTFHRTGLRHCWVP